MICRVLRRLTGKVSARKMGPEQDRRCRARSPLWGECWRLVLLPVMHNSCQILFLLFLPARTRTYGLIPFRHVLLLHKFLTSCKNFRQGSNAEPERPRCIRGPGSAEYCRDRRRRVAGEKGRGGASRANGHHRITGFELPVARRRDGICRLGYLCGAAPSLRASIRLRNTLITS